MALLLLALLVTSALFYPWLNGNVADPCDGVAKDSREACYFGSGLCDNIVWDTFLHDQCFNRTGDCGRIWHSHFRDDCYMGLAVSDPTTCGRINSSYEARRCITALAGYHRDKSYCGRLAGEEAMVCELTSKEPAMCNEINDSYWRHECETIVTWRG